MQEGKNHIQIRVDAGPDADEESVVELNRRLRKDLLELDEVESAEAAMAPAPEGTKSAGIDLQTLLVTLASSGGVLVTLVGFLQAWATRREKTSVTLEVGGDKITISGASTEAELRLVDEWIQRRKG